MDEPDFTTMGYQAVAAVLRQEILDGGYPPDTYLPAEGQLVARFGCGLDTVRDAMQVLRRELLIVTGRGRRSRTPRVVDPEVLTLPVGAQVTARMPYQTDLEQLRCRAEMPLLQVTTPTGAVTVYPADRVLLVTPNPSPLVTGRTATAGPMQAPSAS
ncbi:GntR family transcriptional regulator [Dactylosporangium sp. NPDC000555]|uniref:winged helix-turn-helix domain-containing protein n=1 Tax=Dactylosporangium sp. NPDC000555 TaxID=3154260 RepID=UPI00331F0FB4